MKIVCNRCGYEINRDKYIGEQLVEEYENIYGTHCPSCGKFLSSFKKMSIVSENELKMELLKEQVREILREKIRRK